jgi:hypothetical protein
MKVVAICHRRPEYAPADFAPYLEAESLQALRLFAADKIREIYSRTDGRGAIIVLEAQDEAEARSFLETLPLVQKGMLEFDVYGAKPYRGLIASLPAGG